ncbi:MAG: hypothetical protein V6Z86_02100 [Hyphomicrobiales bacterium]
MRRGPDVGHSPTVALAVEAGDVVGHERNGNDLIAFLADGETALLFRLFP